MTDIPMYIYAQEVPDTGSWLWADDVIVERETSTALGVMQVDQRDPAEDARQAAGREKAAAESAKENRRARRAFVKTQPQVAVTFADLHGGRQLSLSHALELLEDLGGAVYAGDGGSLRFTLPQQIDPDRLNDLALRREALEAIATLDAARPIVHELLRQKRALPNRVPAAGGGVAG